MNEVVEYYTPKMTDEENLVFLKNSFNDFIIDGINYYDEELEENLRKMIFVEFATKEQRRRLLSPMMAKQKKLVERYYNLKELKNASDTDTAKKLTMRLAMLQTIFKSALVLFAAIDDDYLKVFEVRQFASLEDLISYYPTLDFSSITKPSEIKYLLNFTNYMKVALPIIPAKNNVGILLSILERLEGSNQHYITGGAMRPATRIRRDLLMYEGAPQIPKKKKVDMTEMDNCEDGTNNKSTKQRRIEQFPLKPEWSCCIGHILSLDENKDKEAGTVTKIARKKNLENARQLRDICFSKLNKVTSSNEYDILSTELAKLDKEILLLAESIYCGERKTME